MNFLKFLKKLKGFWKIYSGYGYDGETIEFIINNYTEVLESRTRIMSKPTYYASDVIEQIDEWYYGKQTAENKPNACAVEQNVQMVKAKAIIPVMDKFSEEEIKRGVIQHILEDELIPFIEYNVIPLAGGGGICTAKLYVATGDRK